MSSYFEELQCLQHKAHAPYSEFHVAALLELKSGDIISGVNVENASYGATICAERSAFVSGISQYGQTNHYKALHLLAGNSEAYTYPCGICCQFMSELVDRDFPVYVYNHLGKVREVILADLLPQSFLSDKLLG